LVAEDGFQGVNEMEMFYMPRHLVPRMLTRTAPAWFFGEKAPRNGPIGRLHAPTDRRHCAKSGHWVQVSF